MLLIFVSLLPEGRKGRWYALSGDHLTTYFFFWALFSELTKKNVDKIMQAVSSNLER